MSFPTCRHIKENGTFCSSPALKGRELCYFHLRARGQALRAARQLAFEAPSTIQLPLLEDAFAIQAGLQQVLAALATQRIDRRHAGTLIYGLHLASRNLKQMEQMQLAAAETCEEYPTFEQEFEAGEFEQPGPSKQELAVLTARRHFARVREVFEQRGNKGWRTEEWTRRELVEAELALRSLHMALARLRVWEAEHGPSRYAGATEKAYGGTTDRGYFAILHENFPVAGETPNAGKRPPRPAVTETLQPAAPEKEATVSG